MPILEINNLSAGYETKRILEDISFTVKTGELIGIIGPNGAGKSTLLKTIRGILPRQAGEIKAFDRQLNEFSDKDLSREIAYLQQSVETTFGYTAREIVTAGRYPYLKWYEQEGEQDEQIVELCMRYTGMYEYLDTPLDQMSGGQKQRVLLAKVLAQQTPLLFLDEPTTGLDIVYQEDIFRFCSALAKAGKTILMVIHDLNLAYKYCSRLLLVSNGCLMADGSPHEVITNEYLSRAYKANIEVFANQHTQGVDIVTRVDGAEAQERKNILAQICKCAL